MCDYSTINKLSNIWPAFVRPKEDELLSSWIVRNAHNHLTKVYTFCKLTWPEQSFWNRDIDRIVPEEIVLSLAEKTCTHCDVVHGMTLYSYEGTLFSKHNKLGFNKWILPLGIYHRIRKNNGLMFCPGCLRDDGDQPYYRKKWRLATSFVCSKCGCYLEDCCPVCKSPIVFFRNDLGFKDLLPQRSIARCYNCGISLSNMPARPAPISYVELQNSIDQALKLGYKILDNTPVYSHLFFDVLHNISAMIISKRSLLIPFNKKIRNQLNIVCEEYSSSSFLEFQSVEKRSKALFMASWLLDEWPSRFIDFIKPLHLYSSNLFRDLKEIPYWYHKVIYEEFYVSNVNRTFNC